MVSLSSLRVAIYLIVWRQMPRRQKLHTLMPSAWQKQEVFLCVPWEHLYADDLVLITEPGQKDPVTKAVQEDTTQEHKHRTHGVHCLYRAANRMWRVIRWLLLWLLYWYPVMLSSPCNSLWRSGILRWHFRIPTPQSSCYDLMYREGTKIAVTEICVT